MTSLRTSMRYSPEKFFSDGVLDKPKTYHDRVFLPPPCILLSIRSDIGIIRATDPTSRREDMKVIVLLVR